MADYKAIAGETIRIVLNYVDDDEWTVHKTTKEGKVSYKKSREWDGYVYRIDTTMDCSPRTAQEIVFNKDKHLKWNKNQKEITILKTIEEGCEVRHSSSPSAMMGLISPRDFCNIFGTASFPEKDLIIVYYQTVQYETCPPRDKYVRAINYPSGTVIFPIEGEPDKCKAVVITQFDAKLRPKSLAEKFYPSVLLEYGMAMRKGAVTCA
ncbi:stAR-related lipid transfer protein 6-like [Saccoglossus kowalevskii]|uniref:StAR-related lipid transfer protein 6-like n=1 Tax=Saccoglossus kowalevskii TaxID=10224 RepID=A0ABM0MBF6_SACKO|nr:PREDICTED: stAR-related lipid transfer protein 6-like [Saccoglossus kowalevskii]